MRVNDERVSPSSSSSMSSIEIKSAASDGESLRARPRPEGGRSIQKCCEASPIQTDC